MAARSLPTRPKTRISPIAATVCVALAPKRGELVDFQNEQLMTPEDLETRLGQQPAGATVDAVLAELRADPDWTVQEVMLQGEVIAAELLHHPSATAFTLRRRRPSRAYYGSEKGR